jgi:hypothetical protein
MTLMRMFFRLEILARFIACFQIHFLRFRRIRCKERSIRNVTHRRGVGRKHVTVTPQTIEKR